MPGPRAFPSPPTPLAPLAAGLPLARLPGRPTPLSRLLLALPVAWLALAPAAASASDLAEALQFARGVMGDDIVKGYEDFIDWDETEALAIILDHQQRVPDLDREVAPGQPSAPRTRHFEELGGVRLDFEGLRGHIEEAARQTGLPAALIDAVIRTESGYRVGAVSRAGAQGLMQLMPATARELGVTNPLDARQNILGGSRYLRKMYDRFGSVRLALAAYNAGPGAVDRHRGVPPYGETQRYVDTVLRRYESSRLAR